MIAQADLRIHGLDAEGLQKRFDVPNPGEPEKRLIRQWAERAQAGRDFNLQQYKVFTAIDRAWDTGFHQVSQSLIGLLRDIQELKDEEAVVNAAERWGMTHLLTQDIDPKTTLPSGRKRLSLPVMYAINLSIARSYTLQRADRLVNERIQTPLFKFEPAYQTKQNRARCEVLNQRTDQMAREFGYAQTIRQAVTYSAMYGHQLMFPVEEWYERPDWNAGVQPGREGVRFTLPHPSRTYYDLDYPLWTLNYGTGNRFAGYWRITTYGTIRRGTWWNKDRVKWSTRNLDPNWALFFNTTGQCRMAGGWGASNPSWFSQLDRERNIDSAYYTQANDDRPIWLTEHFEVINPAQDLDPKLPDINLWLRVILASDDTPVYVAPFPDRCVTAWLWEPTDNRAINPSLMLEFMPFQDQASNIISQGNLSAKQNLANVTLYDNDVISKEDIKLIENPNEVLYRKLNFVGFSGRALMRQNADVKEAFKSYRFAPQQIGEMLNLLSTLLNLMERTGGMSSQEVGSTASHEQTAEEMRTTQEHTSQRAGIQGFDVEEGQEAMRGVIYNGLMNFGKAESYAYVDKSFDPEYLKSIGFTIVEAEPEGALVKAPLNNLRVEQFVSRRDGPNRIPWVQVGQQMVQLISTLIASDAFAQSPETLTHLLNEAMQFMGFPREFKLKTPTAAEANGAPPQGTQKWVVEQLKQFADQVKDFVGRQVGGGGAGGPPPPPQLMPPPPPPPQVLPGPGLAGGFPPGEMLPPGMPGVPSMPAGLESFSNAS